MRTLEQKISDAGPNNQRVDPHVLTVARNELAREALISVYRRNNVRWYHLSSTPHSHVVQRVDVQGQVFDRTSRKSVTLRVGQTLEIAVFKALQDQPHHFLGAFRDLDEHGDDTLYSKEDPPPTLSGRSLPGDLRLDFLLLHAEAGAAAIEVKNLREWIYPDRQEVRDLLRKACAINAVPVLIARRYAYSTYSVLHRCGVILHQQYNQLYPESERELAALAARKDLLGYHDIRVGNAPDNRLRKFVTEHLPNLLPEARERFEVYRDLLRAYGEGQMSYEEFAARAARRERGEGEDGT
ncbi:MAG TPA: hypothetical protein VFR37_03715 [Longimicrobium sp.]|nr:hypothetical protein [Longimicrobium sp.]